MISTSLRIMRTPSVRSSTKSFKQAVTIRFEYEDIISSGDKYKYASTIWNTIFRLSDDNSINDGIRL